MSFLDLEVGPRSSVVLGKMAIRKALGKDTDTWRDPNRVRSINVSDETTASILEGCKPLAPELLNSNGEFEVLSVQCGLRPSRKGGPRVEVEVVGGEYLVVHSYGHAGAG